jgi:hypothetical protein
VVVVVVVVNVFVAVAAQIVAEKIIGKRGSGGAYYRGKFHGGTVVLQFLSLRQVTQSQILRTLEGQE